MPSGMAGNKGHWLDGLAAQARPPEELFEGVSAENVRLGAGLETISNRVLTASDYW